MTKYFITVIDIYGHFLLNMKEYLFFGPFNLHCSVVMNFSTTVNYKPYGLHD